VADGGTIAIATGILGKATETGVRRHIALLFGGRTVVLCETREPGYEATRPVFVQHRNGLVGRLELLAGKPVNSLRYRSSGVPFGGVRRELETFLRAHAVTAILAEFGHIGCNMAPLGQALGLPVFVYFRGFDASKRLREPKIVRRYQAAMPRLAGVVAVSQFLLDNLAAHGVTHPNTAVIPTGVDMRLFAPGEKDPHLILAVGRIIAKKAPIVTIDAFAAAAREFPRHRLEIIGEGEMRAAAEAHVERLGLRGRVIFHGLRDHAFVRDRIARAQVFLQHSVTDAEGNTEGLPTSIQEAMACGAVVVSTRHAGIPEAIASGVNGVLVEEHDAAGFAAALRGVLADEPGAARMAAAARATALERFDIDKLHARLEAMILAASAPSPG
jgi:glycosyltransferase involved in cell wall biosynthesis